MGFIYKITNKVNGKVYIGQTRRTIKERFLQHKWDREKYNSPLYKAILKYGFNSFSVEKLEECDNSLLNEREIYWIAQYQSNNGKNGYNGTKGGTYVSTSIYRPVDMYDLDLNYIRSFESQTQANEEFGFSKDVVGMCCRGKIHQAGQYIFAFKGKKPRPLPEHCKKKPIHQYDLQGNYIKTYDFVQQALDELGKSLSLATINKSGYSQGYLWSYEKKDKLKPYKRPTATHNSQKKKVFVYDLNGNFIKEYESVRVCAEQMNVKEQLVGAVCNGRYEKMYGYIFKYATQERRFA